MKKILLLSFCLLFIFNSVLFSQTKNNFKLYDSFFFLEFGINYPDLNFVNSAGQRPLNTDAINISGNRLAVGGGTDLIQNRLGLLLNISSNSYDIRTHYTTEEVKYPVHYYFDYASLDANFLLTLSNYYGWIPKFKAGFSYNYMVSGFQELQFNEINLKDDDDFSDTRINYNRGSGFNTANNMLTIGIEGGTSETVDLSSLAGGGGTDDQNILPLVLHPTSNLFTVGIEDGNAQTVDLSQFDDSGTDDQNLSVSAGTATTSVIDIEDGNDVTLAAGTGISLSETANTITISSSGGGTADGDAWA